MVRLRVPGGRTDTAALRRLGVLARRHGNGLLQLTSRASLQVRGLPPVLPAGFEAAVAAAGFLPSRSHERVRNIACSPLTGLAGGRADLRPLLTALDRALTADPVLTGLSGRFLFALDDGRGDLAALEPDLGYRALDAGAGLVLVGDRGRRVAATEAVAVLLDLARSFLTAAAPTGAWRVRDLPGWADALPGLRPVPRPVAEPLPLGTVAGHAVAAVPLGLLTPDQLAAVTAADTAVVLTPWRALVVVDGAARLPALTTAGLVTDVDSPWATVSACVGAPWCGNGRVDTQALVRSVGGTSRRWPRTHVSGCERRCGAPAVPHADLVAPSREDLLAAALPAPVPA